MINLLIVDDHPLVGDGIATMLKDESWLRICGVCKTGRETLEALPLLQPQLIFLDISLPDTDGLELCSRIRQSDKEVKIIGLTSTNEAGIIGQFLARGGNGYLLKNMERGELLEAIGDVLNGRIYLSRAANQKMLEQYQSVSHAIKSAPVLTRREKEILQLLHEGLSGPQIADKLSLSPYTVETHRKNLMQKLQANTTQQLLKIAQEYKLL
ncbi:MAG TPA: response regulator transcription factor [Lacibacter sp.]|nr:response regulator transcription factor [Lacibacter sp.]HMO88457.1 response regulator transcription factor [Lacibacter sp.]HMP86638.1 response regulator transcription factor [Lacibacter sp.]